MKQAQMHDSDGRVFPWNLLLVEPQLVYCSVSPAETINKQTAWEGGGHQSKTINKLTNSLGRGRHQPTTIKNKQTAFFCFPIGHFQPMRS